jgi:hypothetical protein
MTARKIPQKNAKINFVSLQENQFFHTPFSPTEILESACRSAGQSRLIRFFPQILQQKCEKKSQISSSILIPGKAPNFII